MLKPKLRALSYPRIDEAISVIGIYTIGVWNKIEPAGKEYWILSLLLLYSFHQVVPNLFWFFPAFFEKECASTFKVRTKQLQKVGEN